MSHRLAAVSAGRSGLPALRTSVVAGLARAPAGVVVPAAVGRRGAPSRAAPGAVARSLRVRSVALAAFLAAGRPAASVAFPLAGWPEAAVLTRPLPVSRFAPAADAAASARPAAVRVRVVPRFTSLTRSARSRVPRPAAVARVGPASAGALAVREPGLAVERALAWPVVAIERAVARPVVGEVLWRGRAVVTGRLDMPAVPLRARVVPRLAALAREPAVRVDARAARAERWSAERVEPVTVVRPALARPDAVVPRLTDRTPVDRVVVDRVVVDRVVVVVRGRASAARADAVAPARAGRPAVVRALSRVVLAEARLEATRAGPVALVEVCRDDRSPVVAVLGRAAAFGVEVVVRVEVAVRALSRALFLVVRPALVGSGLVAVWVRRAWSLELVVGPAAGRGELAVPPPVERAAGALFCALDAAGVVRPRVLVPRRPPDRVARR